MFAISFYAKTFQDRANLMKIRYRMGMNENPIREYYDTIFILRLFYFNFRINTVLVM